MRRSETDEILYTQLIIARMGEKELMNWWNTDIAYEMGGADFLKRLLGETIAPLSAGEAILKAAYLKESQLIKEMPDRDTVCTLFRPAPEVAVAVKERLRHFKRYPESVPEKILQIIDPEKAWAAIELAEMIPSEDTFEFTKSRFGREINNSLGSAISEIMTRLAFTLKTNKKNNYVLAYYRTA